MARATRPRRRARSKSETPAPAVASTDPRGRIIYAFLQLAADRDYRSIGLADIATAAKVPLADLRALYDGKPGILSDFARRTDEAVLAKGPAQGAEARDRLFEIMMRRFDALAPHKAAIKRIAASAWCDPSLARRLHRAARRSQMWMLVGADIHRGGLAGRIAIEGAVLVYADAMRAFLDDDADLSRTMATLDRGLTRGERAMQWLDGLCRFVPDLGGRLRPRRSGEAAR